MLAQSFLPAADLGITEPQRDALRKTLVLLETGKLRHFSPSKRLEEPNFPFATPTSFSGDFNMGAWSLEHKCGTVCCIGGTAELIGGLAHYSLDAVADENERLHELFYPGGFMPGITPAQAATALRSYLTTGDAKWHEAVA